MNKKWLFLLLWVGWIAACAPLPAPAAPPSPTLVSTPPLPPPAPTLTPTAPPFELSLVMLKNSTYQINSPDSIQIALVNGEFEAMDTAGKVTTGNRRFSGRMVEPVAFGDLDGDGARDAVLIIATNYGGSGTFHEMIVILLKNGQPVQAANRMLGDRIAEKQLAIQDGRIVLDYLRHGPKDGLCCPSEHAVTTFRFQAGAIDVLNDQVIP